MIEIDYRYSRGAKELAGVDPVAFKRIEDAVSLARVAAAHIKQRVQHRGDLKGHQKDYSKKGAVIISNAYKQAAGLSENYYKNSAEMHKEAGTKKGTYDVTGGMWKGNPRVRNMGTRGQAVIEFVGSSIGRRIKTLKSGRRRPQRVRNRNKAGAIFRAHKVSIIAPTEHEQDALVSSVTWHLQKILREIFGLKPGIDFERVEFSGNRQLFEKLKRGIQ